MRRGGTRFQFSQQGKSYIKVAGRSVNYCLEFTEYFRSGPNLVIYEIWPPRTTKHSEHSTDCIYHVRAPPLQSTSASRRQQAVVETSPHWHGHGLVPHSARTAERGRALEPTELVRAERCGHQRCPKRKSAPCNSVFIILVLFVAALRVLLLLQLLLPPLPLPLLELLSPRRPGARGGVPGGGGAASAAGEHLRLRLLQSDICHICHISTSYAGSPISRRLRPDSARGGGGGDGAACAGGEAVVQSSRSVVREAVVPLLVAVQDALRHRARQRQPHLGWFGLGPGSGLG